jgi:hypothetical protein
VSNKGYFFISFFLYNITHLYTANSSLPLTPHFNTTSEIPKQRFYVIRLISIYIQLLTLEMFLLSAPILILFLIFLISIS